MADAKWRPAGPPKPGDNPGADPKVRQVVSEIKAANKSRKGK